MIEIVLRLVERRLGLRLFGKLLERQVLVAEQLRQGRVALLLGVFRLQLRADEAGGRGIDVCLRTGLRCEQALLALDVAPL